MQGEHTPTFLAPGSRRKGSYWSELLHRLVPSSLFLSKAAISWLSPKSQRRKLIVFVIHKIKVSKDAGRAIWVQSGGNVPRSSSLRAKCPEHGKRALSLLALSAAIWDGNKVLGWVEEDRWVGRKATEGRDMKPQTAAGSHQPTPLSSWNLHRWRPPVSATAFLQLFPASETSPCFELQWHLNNSSEINRSPWHRIQWQPCVLTGSHCSRPPLHVQHQEQHVPSTCGLWHKTTNAQVGFCSHHWAQIGQFAPLGEHVHKHPVKTKTSIFS